MKKIFIDSSVIIENCKDNQQADILIAKNNQKDNIIYINPIVVSEVVYILKKKLKYTIKQIEAILNEFHLLSIDTKTVTIAYNYMHQYNMKPNDAMIAATCTYHKIPNLLTMDSDFEQVCNSENINILD